MASSSTISLPTIPDNIDAKLKDYLVAINKVLTTKQLDDFTTTKSNKYKKGIALFTNATLAISSSGSFVPIFGNIIYNDSNLIVKVSDTELTLRAGRKYLLKCSIGGIAYSVANGYMDVQFVNVNTSTLIGSKAESLSCTYSASNSDGEPSLSVIITPDVDTNIKLQVTNISGTASSGSGWNSLIVEELEYYIPESVVSYKKGIALFGNDSYLSASISPGNALPFLTYLFYSDSSNVSKISTTQIKLSAGKRYKLTCQMCVFLTAVAEFTFMFYNATVSSYIGSLGRLTPATDTNNNCITSFAEAVISPTVDTLIEVRTMATSGTTTLIYNGSKLIVEELEAYLPIVTEGYSEIDQVVSGATSKLQAQIGAGIIETGSNTTGKWIKFSDGTMIAWVNAVSIAINTWTTFSYPTQFNSVSNVQATLIDDPGQVGVRSFGTTTAQVYQRGVSGVTISVWFIVFGRWKA